MLLPKGGAWSECCRALQVIEQINLPKQARTNSFNYSSFLPNASICTGTHSVGYSNISQQWVSLYSHASVSSLDVFPDTFCVAIINLPQQQGAVHTWVSAPSDKVVLDLSQGCCRLIAMLRLVTLEGCSVVWQGPCGLPGRSHLRLGIEVSLIILAACRACSMSVSFLTGGAISATRSNEAGSAADHILTAVLLCSAFFECADNMGVFEWNTVSNTFVQFFPNITGYVSVAPGDDEVLVVGYDSNVNVLKPQGESQDPSVKGPCLLCTLCGRIMCLSIDSRGDLSPYTTSCILAAS